MRDKNGFIGGFLVLGFVVFIAGFITGMLAVAFVSIKDDPLLVRFLLFILGLLSGMAIIALTFITLKFSQLRNTRLERVWKRFMITLF